MTLKEYAPSPHRSNDPCDGHTTPACMLLFGGLAPPPAMWNTILGLASKHNINAPKQMDHALRRLLSLFQSSGSHLFVVLPFLGTHNHGSWTTCSRTKTEKKRLERRSPTLPQGVGGGRIHAKDVDQAQYRAKWH
uniref:Uncharacterized protein n=1 Tax=Eutreptiella gymnastica TaxID=73025 RepID=A0A7S1IGD5_9EUGL